MITTLDTQKEVEYFSAKLAYTTGPVELKTMIENHEDINIIDVRYPDDFDSGHVPGAVNLPQPEWDSFHGLSRDKVNVVYCYTQQCHLAAKACKHFAEHGYPVIELEGGFNVWQNHSFPVE